LESPPLPSDLIDRPEWWHLVWLLGLAVALAFVVLRGAPAPLWITGTAVGAVAAIIGGVMQLAPATDGFRNRLTQARTAPASMQTCETREQTRYCAFPEFRNLIGEWAEVVSGQRAKLPPAAAGRTLYVRQHLPLATAEQGLLDKLPLDRWDRDDAAAGTPGAIPVSTRWAAGGSDSFNETEVIGFATQTATVLVTGSRVPADGTMVCGSRGAVVLWLAATASADTRDAFDTALSHSSGGGVFLSVLNSSTSVQFGPRELALGRAMLAGGDDVSSKVEEQWSELTDPGTDTRRAGQILGVTPASAAPAPGSRTCP